MSSIAPISGTWGLNGESQEIEQLKVAGHNVQVAVKERLALTASNAIRNIALRCEKKGLLKDYPLEAASRFLEALHLVNPSGKSSLCLWSLDHLGWRVWRQLPYKCCTLHDTWWDNRSKMNSEKEFSQLFVGYVEHLQSLQKSGTISSLQSRLPLVPADNLDKALARLNVFERKSYDDWTKQFVPTIKLRLR